MLGVLIVIDVGQSIKPLVDERNRIVRSRYSDGVNKALNTIDKLLSEDELKNLFFSKDRA